MKKVILSSLLIVFALVFAFAFNASGALQNTFDKNFKGFSQSDYLVYTHSGGKIIQYWILRDKFVNTETGSDGYFFIDKNGSLVRVGGNTTVQEIKGLNTEQVIVKYNLKEAFVKEYWNEKN